MTKIRLNRFNVAYVLNKFKGHSWHSVKLYETNVYDTKCLQYNPFIDSLTSTRADGTMLRFPKGNMLELTVGPIPEHHLAALVHSNKNKKLKKYWLLPILQPLSKKIFSYTSSYIISNEKYIDSVVNAGGGLINRFIPRKFFHRNRVLVDQVNIMPNFQNIISKCLHDDVSKGLENADIGKGHKNGLLLKNSGSLLEFDHQLPIINITKLLPNYDLKNKIFLSYETNSKLCQSIIKLVNYKS